jgi:hypothetical protein
MNGSFGSLDLWIFGSKAERLAVGLLVLHAWFGCWLVRRQLARAVI